MTSYKIRVLIRTKCLYEEQTKVTHLSLSKVSIVARVDSFVHGEKELITHLL